MLLDVSDLTYAYASSGRGCRGITLQAESGSITALIGPSGCGKSTALACIAGVLTGATGTMSWDGSLSRTARATLVMQAAPLFDRLSLWENIALAWGGPIRRHRAAALERLTEFGLSGCADDLPAQLSVGQRQRGAVVAALAQATPLLLLDEPTGNLDDANAQQLLSSLRRAASAGKAVLLATHDRRVIEQVDKVYELSEAAA